VKYELVRTYVGGVADVEVDLKTGKVRVTKFYVAHDCGQIINPDGVMNQIEGNIIQTVSRTLKEELLFDRSAVTSLHWATYPILTFPEVPDVIIELIAVRQRSLRARASLQPRSCHPQSRTRFLTLSACGYVQFRLPRRRWWLQLRGTSPPC
jgi:hypothetical protein